MQDEFPEKINKGWWPPGDYDAQKIHDVKYTLTRKLYDAGPWCGRDLNGAVISS